MFCAPAKHNARRINWLRRKALLCAAAVRPCSIAFTGSNDPPSLVRDSAQAHPKRVKTKLDALGAVVKAVVVMPVKTGAHAQAAGQIVNGTKSMWVSARSLVRHQNVGPPL